MDKISGDTLPDSARAIMRASSRVIPGHGSCASGWMEGPFGSLVEQRRGQRQRHFGEAVSEIGRRTNASARAALFKNEHFPTLSLAPLHLIVLSVLNHPALWMEKQGISLPRWRWGTVSSLNQP